MKADESVPLGEFLRQSRLRRGMSLQQIAAETKIPLRHLHALECDDVADVPAGLYRRARVLAYARAVHLDPSALVQLERTLRATNTVDAAPSTTAGKRTPFRNGVLIALMAIGAAMALTFALRRGASQPAASPKTIAIEPRLSQEPASPKEAEAPTSQHEATTHSAVATVGSLAAQAVPVPEGAVEPRVVQPQATSELVITSEPPGARVTVDGIGWGFTPVTVRHLPPGAKRIRVTKEGYSSEEREVRVAGDRPSELQIRLQAVP